jgi:peptide/nickel transport system substrate-binding protein
VKRPIGKLLLSAAALAVMVTLVTTAATGAKQKHGTAKAGGVYRVGWESDFGFTDGFDPTGEYLGEAFSMMSNMLVRTLVGYTHRAGAPGNKIVADLATTVPKPTNGGKTYTFKIRQGAKFGPPLSRQITSKDILYAMQRLATPKDGAQYAFYYSVIKGFDAFGKGTAKTITGIHTPNNSTISFDLTQPTGDFLFRMGMPATGPIPPEVGKCFAGVAEKYGRDLISSGPYMIEGEGAIDISSCDKLKPISGYDPTSSMTLVRNPAYSKASDASGGRENLPDKFVFTVDANSDDIYQKLENGDLEDEVSSVPPQILQKYATDPNLKPRLHLNSGDRTWYITMNLTQAPFDDLKVRRAMNFVMDKDALRKAWGGATAGAVAHHIVPDTLFNNQLAGYDPYKTPGEHGSVAKAKAALKGSKYDTRKNGTCAAKACKNVLLIADKRGVDDRMLPVIQANAAKIGITFTVRTVAGAYPTIQTPGKNVPIAERPGWGKDYADALTFFTPLFDGRTIIPAGNTNYSLVGITPATAKKVGAKGNLRNVPNVNEDLDHCSKLIGQPRLTCYENLDKKLTWNVVPWIPYLWSSAIHIVGPKVAKWDFDQFGGSIGYGHVAVK